MNQTVIILAAGEQRRFGDSETLKQLLPICDGETLLTRMIRQCRDRRISDIVVMTTNLEISEAAYDAGASCKHPEAHRYTCETILSSRRYWGDKTIILLGDVYYSKKYMDNIIFSEGDLKFFATPAEVHAFKFVGSFHFTLRIELIDIIVNAESQEGGKVRRLMERFPDDCVFENHDESTDIDTPKEYEVFMRDVIHERKYRLTDRRS